MSLSGPEELEGSRAPAGIIAPNGPGLQLLTPSLLTSSSLQVECMFMDWVFSGRNSGQQEHWTL